MIARCILFVVDGPVAAHATVILTPCWLARLFGARGKSVDLRRGAIGWWTVATDRDVNKIDHGDKILNALDFRDVGTEPRRLAMPMLSSEAIAP